MSADPHGHVNGHLSGGGWRRLLLSYYYETLIYIGITRDQDKSSQEGPLKAK